MLYIKSPYDDFYIEIRKEKRPEYLKIGRNDLCPCGSGKKYKKCHLGTTDELLNHHIVHISAKEQRAKREIRYFGTWKQKVNE